MDDAIYLRDGDELIEMRESEYEYERVLQDRLVDYPRLLAGSQMSDIGIDQWVLVAKEAAVPDKEGGGERWSADHLFVDQNAIPTIVEVKRSDNTEIRRQIVGQMLDYVAHATLYWDGSMLENRFVDTCETLGLDPEVTIKDLTSDEDVTGFWEDVERNLRSKQVRLLFVADEVPSELKRVVEFLNEATQNVEVLAIEVIKYASDEETVFVPRLYGQTEEAKAKSKSTSRTGQEYVETEAELFDDLDKKLASGLISQDVYDAFVELYEFGQEIGDNIRIGGAKNANFKVQVEAHQDEHSGQPSVFTANVAGEIQVWPARMPLESENPISWDQSAYEEYTQRFQSLDGVPENETSAPIDILSRNENLNEFKEIVTNFVNHCRSAKEVS